MGWSHCQSKVQKPESMLAKKLWSMKKNTLSLAEIPVNILVSLAGITHTRATGLSCQELMSGPKGPCNSLDQWLLWSLTQLVLRLLGKLISALSELSKMGIKRWPTLEISVKAFLKIRLKILAPGIRITTEFLLNIL